MRLQANLPDTLPGQSVSFLVFGDVQLENKVASPPSPSITLTSNTVLLGDPQDSNSIVGGLASGDKVFALSQSADGAWVRVELDGSDSRTGWIPSSLLSQAGELPKFEAEADAPMQAFSLQTGVSGTKCDNAPQDGILIQTPGGADKLKIKLTVNNVNVELGSTAFLQAVPSSFMRFSIIEGEGKVESKGQTVDVPAGTWVSIPMDANLEPIGTISQPKGYQVGDMDNLPIGLLGRPITVAPPIITAPTTLCVSNPNGAWLRAQPNSANQTILRVLPTGTSVNDSGSTASDGVQDWRQVETSDEQLTGWIEAASLSNCGNSNPVSVTTTPAVLENCTPRADWTLTYTVQPGNTLAEIARAAAVSLTELAQGNCIADVNRIVAGQKLLVPRLVIVVTPLPPIQPPAVTQEAPSQPEQPQQPQQPQITSGRWQLTITTQQVGCNQPPKATTVSTTANVNVSADGNTLTITAGAAATNAPATYTFQRTSPTNFSGAWGRGGKAALNVTGTNQAAIYATVPCG